MIVFCGDHNDSVRCFDLLIQLVQFRRCLLFLENTTFSQNEREEESDLVIEIRSFQRGKTDLTRIDDVEIKPQFPHMSCNEALDS